MSEQIAKPPPPLSCYGLEQDLRTAQCQVCEHRVGCTEVMGARAGKIPLDRAKIDLVSILRPLDSLDPDEDDFHGLYAMCYRQVFNTRPDRYFEENNKAHQVIKTAHETGCPLRLFMLAVMMAHKDTTPDRRFFGGMLAGPSAVKRMSIYRRVARETSGVFDPETAARLTGSDADALRDSLLSSEEIAATFIVGHKARFTTSATGALFSDRELALHPAWLATESVYIEWVTKTPASTKELARHRARAAQIDRRSLPALAKLRGSHILGIAAKVLRKYNLRPEHLLVREPVTDATQLWSWLGVAVRQLACLRYLSGETASPMVGQVEIEGRSELAP